MGTLELKNVIAQYVSKADDKVLRIVKAVFETYEKDTELEEMPEIFHKLVDQGLEDIKQGRTTPHEEVISEFREKYNIA